MLYIPCACFTRVKMACICICACVCLLRLKKMIYFFFCFCRFAWRISLRTLSTKRCLHFFNSSSSSTSFPVIMPSSRDLASSFTLCQTSSLLTALFFTRSCVKLSRWLVCSSVNFLQNVEVADARDGAWTGPDLSLSHGAEERNFRTLSVLVSCSVGSGISFLNSSLIRRSFRTIALTECAFRMFSVETFFIISPSLIAPVQMKY